MSNKNSSEELSKKILNYIKNDKRTYIERTARNSPKKEFLLSIIDSIKKLLEKLYSTTEQLKLINNNTPKKFTISDTTYKNFLEENLYEEYIDFKIKRYYILNLKKIIDAINKYSEYDLQFKYLNFSGKFGTLQLDLNLKNYIEFVEFYLKNKNISDVACKRANKPFKKKELNLGSGKKFLDDEKKANKPAKITVKKETVSNNLKTVSSGNSKNLIVKDREKLKNKKGWYEIDLLDAIDINNIVPRFEIKYNQNEFPDEIINDKIFMFGDVNTKTDKFKEDFVYFWDIDLIHCINPETIGFCNNLLIVTDTAYNNKFRDGYLFFRFFNGVIYFIENYRVPNGSPTFIRTFANWEQENCTHEYYDFIKGYRKMKRDKNNKL